MDAANRPRLQRSGIKSGALPGIEDNPLGFREAIDTKCEEVAAYPGRYGDKRERHHAKKKRN
jgi:hypothetical protein